MHHELSVYIWILLITGIKFILSVLQIQKHVIVPGSEALAVWKTSKVPLTLSQWLFTSLTYLICQIDEIESKTLYRNEGDQ